MNQGQQKKQRLLVGVMIGLGALAVIVFTFTFILGDDGFALQINKTIESQDETKAIAKLVQEYSTNTSADNFAATLAATATSSSNELAAYRSQRVGNGIPLTKVDTAEEESSLEAARQSGAVEQVAVDLLSNALQRDIQNVQELQQLTNNDEFSSQLSAIQQDLSLLLDLLQDSSF